MPYEFSEWDDEPEPQAGSSRLGGPPGKSIGIGVLDPPGPPSKPGLPRVWLTGFSKRMLTAFVLAVLALGIVALVYFWLYTRF